MLIRKHQSRAGPFQKRLRDKETKAHAAMPLAARSLCAARGHERLTCTQQGLGAKPFPIIGNMDREAAWIVQDFDPDLAIREIDSILDQIAKRMDEFRSALDRSGWYRALIIHFAINEVLNSDAGALAGRGGLFDDRQQRGTREMLGFLPALGQTREDAPAPLGLGADQRKVFGRCAVGCGLSLKLARG